MPLEGAPPDALENSYRMLIAHIMYHAVKDRRDIEKSGDHFADDDHQKFCISEGFRSGEEELESFCRSRWFDRLCEHLQDITGDDIRNEILGIYTE